MPIRDRAIGDQSFGKVKVIAGEKKVSHFFKGPFNVLLSSLEFNEEIVIMRNILILGLSVLTLNAFANYTTAEEAMILNQELQFLEESVNNVQSVSLNEKGNSLENALNGENLERKYFNDTVEDSVNTRSAGPKRRGL